jgi:hypothetical protein
MLHAAVLGAAVPSLPAARALFFLELYAVVPFSFALAWRAQVVLTTVRA